MTKKFGRDRARANLSARQAREKGLLTSGTCGPLGFTTSRALILRGSLESRLRLLTDLHGSTLFKLIWKIRVTPQQRTISALLGSGRAINVNASSGLQLRRGWSTPAARDWKDQGALENSMIRKDGKRRSSVVPRQVYIMGKANGLGWQTEKGFIAPTNPEFVRFLMGIPPEMGECAPTGTPSTSEQREPSSEHFWRLPMSLTNLV